MTTRPWLCAAILFGCTSEPQPVTMDESELTQQDKEEIAKAVGVTLNRQFDDQDGLTVVATEIALGVPPVWLDSIEGGIYVGELAGLSFDLDASCLDASAAPMVECNAETDQATLTANVEGQVSLLGWTGRFGVTVSWAISGLQTAVVTVEGQAEIELASQFMEWFRPVTHDATFVISARGSVTVARLTMIPIAGSSELTLVYERSSSDSSEVAHWELLITATIADGQATVRIGGNTFSIDLATGTVTSV